MATIKVKQVRSAIGRTKTQKKTLEALGLKKLHQVVEHEATPAVLGLSLIHISEPTRPY